MSSLRSITVFESSEERKEVHTFSISHLTFIINLSLVICMIGVILVRVGSCNIVDRSHLSAKRTIHEVTRSKTKHDDMRLQKNDKMRIEN